MRKKKSGGNLKTLNVKAQGAIYHPGGSRKRKRSGKKKGKKLFPSSALWKKEGQTSSRTVELGRKARVPSEDEDAANSRTKNA